VLPPEGGSYVVVAAAFQAEAPYLSLSGISAIT